MLDDIVLQPINPHDHSTAALDLARRAQDYVMLETGQAPDAAYIQNFFQERPQGLGSECLLHFGIMNGPLLVGIIATSEGYETVGDWWIALMLIDPAFRNQSVGNKAITDLKRLAKQRKINMLKLAVLSANPRGLKFWHREGFSHHRNAPAQPGSDGHDRVVLKLAL